jgi:hypothetical protein
MIVSTVLNLFFMPVAYLIVKSILDRNKPAMESAPQTSKVTLVDPQPETSQSDLIGVTALQPLLRNKGSRRN